MSLHPVEADKPYSAIRERASRFGFDLHVARERGPVRLSRGSEAWYAASVALLEFATVAGAAYLGFAVYHGAIYQDLSGATYYVQASLALGALHSLICLVDEQYDVLDHRFARRGLTRGLGAIALSFCFFLSLTFILGLTPLYSRGTFLTQVALVFPAVFIARAVMTQAIDDAQRYGALHGRRVIVVSLAGAAQISDIAEQLALRPADVLAWCNIDARHDDDHPDWSDEHEPIADDLLAETLGRLREECRRLQPSAVVIAFDAANMRNIAQIAATFSALPVRIQLLPSGLGALMQRSRVTHCGRTRVLELLSRPCSLMDRMVKRGFDLAIAICGVIALAPVLVMIAIAIKLDSRGSVFFVQTRHGFNEEPIRVMKFRTMTTMEDGPDFRQAIRGDTRVTRVGRILRRTNLDELPQLFNVIAGTMSIVGPRPHAVAHNQMFVNQIALMSRRHNVRPGITGWAQVRGYRGETDTSEKMRKRVELDLYYIDNWSIIFDIKIVIMTMFSRRAFMNAY